MHAIHSIMHTTINTTSPWMDIKQAYRNVPVSAKDRQYLRMQWEGQVFIDGVLLFGLRLAP